MSDIRTFRLKPNVHANLVGDEAVAISFLTGHYYSIRGTGALIVGALSKGFVHEEELVRSLTLRYGPQVPGELITEDTPEFLRDLERHGLIERYVTEGPFVAPSDGVEMPYGFREIEAHKEFADIVTLDPIHDVADAGWPERA